METDRLKKLIDLWFEEDIRSGDHTSLCCIPADKIGTQQLIIKESGIIAGVRVAKEIIHHFDEKCELEVFIEDGTEVKPNDVVFKVTGRVLSLLQIERTMLNIMQRMSGIATTTHLYQKEIEGTGCYVLDTRKTTPGLRYLEKEAVKIGGGKNHRIGLFDMILLKDNHVDFAGGIKEALLAAKAYCEKKNMSLPIEIETRNEKEINEALEVDIANRIMLDNFSVEQTKSAVKMIREWEKSHHHIEIESSGGITLTNIRNYALCGVDFVSVGALTHSVKSLDMSFKAVK